MSSTDPTSPLSDEEKLLEAINDYKPPTTVETVKLLSESLPPGIHSTLATAASLPLADFDTIRRRWKVVTLKTAKDHESAPAKLLRFLSDLHASLNAFPRPTDYQAAPGKVIWEAVLAAAGKEDSQFNPHLPESWLEPLRSVWQTWLDADSATKRRRTSVGQGRNKVGNFAKNPPNEGKFQKNNPHRFKKRPAP
jgi:hypothetical protein